MKRRDFLKAAAVAAPVIVSQHALSAPGQSGANDRIHLAGIGIGGRGSDVLGEFLGQPDVRCVAVCDARADRRARTKNMVDSRYGNQDCEEYRDFRELLARHDVDAVLEARRAAVEAGVIAPPARKKKKKAQHDPEWARAKRLCRLNADDVRKAKELGLNPRKLVKNIPGPSEPWKSPVNVWIRELYEEKQAKALRRQEN